jgi:hypothetical protein
MAFSDIGIPVFAENAASVPQYGMASSNSAKRHSALCSEEKLLRQRFTHKEAIETGAKEQQAAAENKDIGELTGSIKDNPGDHRRQRGTEKPPKFWIAPREATCSLAPYPPPAPR